MKIFGKIVFVILLQTVVCFSLRADDAKEKEQAVYELFEAQGMQEQMNKIIVAMLQSQINAAPQLKPYQLDLLQFYMSVAGYEVIKKEMAQIYMKHFTLNELREMTKFYRSPVGQKMKSKSAEILIESNKLSQKRLEAAFPKFVQEMRKKGKF